MATGESESGIKLTMPLLYNRRNRCELLTLLSLPPSLSLSFSLSLSLSEFEHMELKMKHSGRMQCNQGCSHNLNTFPKIFRPHFNSSYIHDLVSTHLHRTGKHAFYYYIFPTCAGQYLFISLTCNHMEKDRKSVKCNNLYRGPKTEATH